ncbi:MAG TPA: TetR family transcriptional regulator, partial [Caulobacteraceae bacterium]|nr:TetR family transcriptional regulator [Caulobacteraceae bacterium]
MPDETGDRRMALERRKIVETALGLLDDVGMDGLSTRRLAAELGVKGPSLYWHFKNMRELS